MRCVGAGRRGSGCAPSPGPPWAVGAGQDCDWVPTQACPEGILRLGWPAEVSTSLPGGGASPSYG